MNSMPSLRDLILVAFLPSPRDLQIARVLGWYRIPVRTAPRVLNVDHLAFYQPASFGEGHKWRVEYLAPVRGHELTTRLELLTEEPHHPRAHEEYYKIQIGPLQRLPHPILAGDWKRFTFLYTTGEYLHQAQTLRDLTVRSGERQSLWRSLRDRAASPQEYQTPEPDLEPAVLAALLGIHEAGEGYEEAEDTEETEDAEDLKEL
ncbi:MAG: hypothetical protein MAG431_00292 [Chloroflexi bacterium]|nr:hypothetical protein [Chloroflexota bacterium]